MSDEMVCGGSCVVMRRSSVEEVVVVEGVSEGGFWSRLIMSVTKFIFPGMWVMSRSNP